MTRPILDPSFWRQRLQSATADGATGQLHRAVFECSPERWQRIEAKHREILARHIQPGDSILDAGCGWGRLLDLLPAAWHTTGRYVGVDLSPDFIDMARQRYPGKLFLLGDLRHLLANGLLDGEFHWAVLVSIRPMVRRELGEEVWQQMERELHRVAERLLFLEYDEDGEGFVE